MQIKNIDINTKKLLWLFVRVLLVIGCVYFIYDRIRSTEIEYASIVWPDGLIVTLLILFILMIINWSLEALRWKLSLSPYENISFLKSLNVVLAGLSMGWVMPFTAGETVARLVPMKDKFQTTSAMLMNRSIMMCLTMLYGSYAVWVYSKKVITINWIFVLIVFTLIILGYILRGKLHRFFDYFKVLNFKTAFGVIGISVARYAVFVFQFYILLSLFMPDVPGMMIFAGTGWIFLARSILPTVMGGVGIREASGVVFFSSMEEDLVLVVLPIFILWITNTVLPSLVGLLSVWKLKPYRSTSLNIAK